MENASAKIYLRDDFTRKDGTKPVYLRLTIGSKVRKYSLGVSAKEDNWDKKNSRVKRGDIKHLNKNLTIESNLKKAEDIIFQFKIERKAISFHEFETLYNVVGDKSTKSFIEFALKEIETDYSNKGSYDTYRTRKSAIKKVKDFANKDLNFEDITYDFLKKLDSYMIGQGNSQTSRVRILKTIKTFINRAITHGLAKENAVNSYKYKDKCGVREYLTAEEVKRLNELLGKPETESTIKRALIPFLFSCYTGIRYKDICNLRHKNILKVEGDGKIHTFIRFTMHKTKEVQEIPLNSKAVNLLPRKTFDEDRVFRVYTNQPQNRYLKDAAKLAEIKKRITFHCSRHTFATLLLGSSVPVETVSKLLGHQDLQTTLIYAKVLPESKINAVTLLDNL
ncbi:tyrosine recombinase [Tenuifilaceae bacterium CYCD]|nr:tyrosine recombinase [Tenuifilaceae bacterium CYCD]